VPDTRAVDYLPLVKLMWAGGDRAVGDVIRLGGAVYEGLGHPVLLAALNIEPAEGSAALAGAVIRETLAAGGQACRPLIAREGLGTTMIEPALALLAQRKSPVRLGHQLHAIRFSGARVEALDFGNETVALAGDD